LGVVAMAIMLAGGSGMLAACNRNPGNNTATTGNENGATGTTGTNVDNGDRVSHALKDANLNGVRVDYDKNADVVHLKGTVDNQADKARAEQVAQGAVGTSGKILNEIDVKGMDNKTANDQDKLIKDSLSDEINKDQVLRDRTIHFDVNNSVVTVTGNVRTAAEKNRVTQMVHSVHGVKDVANELKVEPKR
jgi:hyperosmotically inducible protein